VVASFLHRLREMDSPNLGIGLLVLIIMGRLWFGRRMLIFGIDCPWIGALDGVFGEEALEIRDAMEEEFQ
jgi:hypothetical protein